MLWCASYLACEETLPEYGWVDDPNDPKYNQFITTASSYPASHEHPYLSTSSVYDLLAVIGYNDDPIIPGAGSAIFFHVVSEGYGPTAGCVALSKPDLVEVLRHVTEDTRMHILGMLKNVFIP